MSVPQASSPQPGLSAAQPMSCGHLSVGRWHRGRHSPRNTQQVVMGPSAPWPGVYVSRHQFGVSHRLLQDPSMGTHTYMVSGCWARQHHNPQSGFKSPGLPGGSSLPSVLGCRHHPCAVHRRPRPLKPPLCDQDTLTSPGCCDPRPGYGPRAVRAPTLCLASLSKGVVASPGVQTDPVCVSPDASPCRIDNHSESRLPRRGRQTASARTCTEGSESQSPRGQRWGEGGLGRRAAWARKRRGLPG